MPSDVYIYKNNNHLQRKTFSTLSTCIGKMFILIQSQINHIRIIQKNLIIFKLENSAANDKSEIKEHQIKSYALKQDGDK